MPTGSGIDVVFSAGVRAHPTLIRGLDAIEGFLRDPGAGSVAALADWDRPTGRYRYATTAPLSLAELLAHQPTRGPCGLRAALELMIGVALALEAVRDRALQAGVTAHGCLTPWRIALHPDGTPQILGYGLPDAPLFAYLDGLETGVSLDTLRYATPERLDDVDQDARSDLYALALIGAEMALGRPIFDDSPERVVERILAGDAPELIEALGAELGEAALDLLCVATEADPSDRFRDPREFIRQARPLLAGAPGRPLGALVVEALAARGPAEEAEDPPTDVVERPLPAAALPARVSAPPPDEEDDDGETEAGLDAVFELVPAVPALPAAPDLEQVRAHARAIVDRARQLAEQADAMQIIAVQRAHAAEGVGPSVRKLKEVVGKAHKAASSTANTAKLVELDDQVADALVTLEMVRSAEKLCVGAATQALELLYQIQAEVDRARAEQATLERASRLAEEAAERAVSAADEAEALARRLVDRAAAGGFGVDGARELVRVAREHADTADTARERALQAGQDAREHTRGVEAERDAQRARAAADDAHEALANLRRVVRQIDELEAEAREAQASRARSSVARGRGAALAAAQSLERARRAASQATIPAGMDLLKAIEHHAEAAEEAARRSEARAASVLEAPQVPDDPATRLAARRAIVQAEDAAEVAENQAREASTLSDRLVALAGEAAAAQAALSKLQAEAAAVRDRVLERAAELLQTWRALAEDTEEVQARIARDAIQVARRAVDEVERRVEALRAEAEAIEASADPTPGGAAERIGRVREEELELTALIERARGRCREARAAAARELEELAVRNAARNQLRQAAERARDHAVRCRTAVDAAWAAYQETAALLAAAPVEAADALRARAYDIIDIAEYQTGEAEAAAAAAAAQSDPADARSHASTAASFEQRITADLPEAMELLERARAQAATEIGRLQQARQRTAAALDAAREAARTLDELHATGRDAARGWADDPAVAMALAQIEAAAEGLDEDLAEVRYAAERAGQVEAADDAMEMVPIAEAAAQRLTTARARGEAMAATLDAAVRTARLEVETREGAVAGALEALHGIEKAREALGARSKRLYTAVETHQASGELARETVRRMRAAVDGVAEAEATAREATRRVREAGTASEARTHHTAARTALAEAERLLSDATDAEAQGVKAAEREAVEREAAEQRQLEQAHALALAHVATAKQAAERGVAVLKEAAEQLGVPDDPQVRQLLDQAHALARDARTAATGALKAARECQRAKRAAAASEWEQRAGALAGDANAAVGEAHARVRQAVDLGRKADAEARALASVKAEITSIRVMVEEGVEQAEADRARVVEAAQGSEDPDTLACVGQAEQAVQTVRRSAAKILAAAPLALQADGLEVAQGLLDTCRLALERADEAADAVRELIQRVRQLRAEEANRAAQRLAEAREAAERPAAEAAALAARCADQAARVEREADAPQDPQVQAALDALRQATAQVHALAERTEQAARPARQAPDLRAVEAVEAEARQAASQVTAAADGVREAIAAVGAAVQAAAAREQLAQAHRMRAAEGAAAAEVLAGDAASAAEALEHLLTESQVEDDDAATAFRETTRAAKAVAAAAAAAFERAESAMGLTDPDQVQRAADEVDATRARAESLLRELQQHDRRCRDLLDLARRRGREDARRHKDEALRAKLRRRRSESQAASREALLQRLDARDEQKELEQPNLSALRERLRSRRKSGTTERPQRLERRPPARPEPGEGADDTRARRRRPGPDDSSRLSAPMEHPRLPPVADNPRSEEERSASRQRREERLRRRAEPAEPEARPGGRGRPFADPPTRTEVGIITPGDAPGSEGADALLRRLRRNRGEDER